MLVQIFADTPEWVVDGKNYLGFGASVVAAFGLVWRYAIKPYLEHRELERKRDLQEAAAVRKGEITVALIPINESINALKNDVQRTGDKVILQGDAIYGINRQLNVLAEEQRMLHQSVRAHMDAEDARHQGET